MSAVTPEYQAGTGWQASSQTLTLEPDSWEARLVRQARLLHANRKPVILLVRLGDCPPHLLKTVPVT